jgi:hypothetical protein
LILKAQKSTLYQSELSELLKQYDIETQDDNSNIQFTNDAFHQQMVNYLVVDLEFDRKHPSLAYEMANLCFQEIGPHKSHDDIERELIEFAQLGLAEKISPQQSPSPSNTCSNISLDNNLQEQIKHESTSTSTSTCTIREEMDSSKNSTQSVIICDIENRDISIDQEIARVRLEAEQEEQAERLNKAKNDQCTISSKKACAESPPIIKKSKVNVLVIPTKKTPSLSERLNLSGSNNVEQKSSEKDSDSQANDKKSRHEKTTRKI